VPIDVNLEKELPSDVKARLAFAQQKLGEMVAVKEAVSAQISAGAGDLDLSTYTGAPSASPTAKSIPADYFQRPAPFAERRPQQPQFPAFPTTTIGSFPQTPAIRRARLQYKKGTISEIEYRERIASEIGYSIGAQEALGLDVLVHGEAERTDMVEYFGMKLFGYSFTQHAWVQSYGSRYVRPPLITGDISRQGPMTVHEFELAQSMTNRAYVKGMLTGAVTCINWSFPRKDITRSEQAYQIALALREEIADLEKAGCRIIQVRPRLSSLPPFPLSFFTVLTLPLPPPLPPSLLPSRRSMTPPSARGSLSRLTVRQLTSNGLPPPSASPVAWPRRRARS